MGSIRCCDRCNKYPIPLPGPVDANHVWPRFLRPTALGQSMQQPDLCEACTTSFSEWWASGKVDADE